jgi:hypothetical protein
VKRYLAMNRYIGVDSYRKEEKSYSLQLKGLRPLLYYYRILKACCIWLYQSFTFRVRVMVFKATFNNISVISWRSVLLVEETGVPGENHQTVASHWQTLSHMLCWVHLAMNGVRTHNFSGDIFLKASYIWLHLLF